MRYFLTLGLVLIALSLNAMDYDPLYRSDKPLVPSITLDHTDAVRARKIPMRIYLPQQITPAPIIIFSHGLGGSRNGNAFMGEHWSARGYVAVFIQHPGSDETVWKDIPLAKRMAAMQQAANSENFLLRVADVKATIDALERWQIEVGHQLNGRLDLTRIGMSGHSFGAVTTQAVSGQRYAKINMMDPRIDAAIAFSPSSPGKGADTANAFGSVAIPWLLMTGTLDSSLVGGQTPASRREVYPALPAQGQAYELVLYNAEHSAFTERALPGETQPRNPNHHRAILAISTAFLDAWLGKDVGARAWLDGDGPRSMLQAADVWQRK